MTRSVLIRRIEKLKTLSTIRSDSEYDAVLLLKEYLRRVTIWCRKLDIQFSPFADLPLKINPELDFPKERPALIRNLNNVSTEMKYFLQIMLLWDEVLDLLGEEFITLPDPYEPLLLCFETGSYLRKVHGVFEIRVSQGKITFIELSEELYAKEEPFILIDKQ